MLFKTDLSALTKADSLVINNVNVCFESFIKFLGIWMGSYMKWIAYIDCLSKRLNCVIYTSNDSKHHVDNDTLKIVFCANSQSLMMYGIILYGNSSNAKRILKD